MGVSLHNRHAKAWRSGRSFPNRSRRSAVGYAALHWQWTRTEVCFKAFTQHFLNCIGISQTYLEFSSAPHSQHRSPSKAWERPPHVDRLSSTLSRKLAPRSSELAGWVLHLTGVAHTKEDDSLSTTGGDDSAGSITWLRRCTSLYSAAYI